HQVDAAPFGDHYRNRRGRIAEVAEVAGIRRAGAYAGRYAVHLGDRLVVDAVDAQRALLHDARGDIHLAGAVRAGPGAQAAADALVFVDEHDAVLAALVRGAGRADRDARRILAVQAGFREMHDARIARLADDLAALGDHLERVDPIEPCTRYVGSVGILVRQRVAVAAGVPLLARHGAGVTADADVEVDDQAEALRRRMDREAGHSLHSWP